LLTIDATLCHGLWHATVPDARQGGARPHLPRRLLRRRRGDPPRRDVAPGAALTRGAALRGLLILTLVAYAIGAALGQVTASVDLWWHLASGRYIVEHLEIPRHDVFSYTHAGARWVNPGWLADVLLFELFRLGGDIALVGFKVAVTTTFLLVAAWVAFRRSGSLVFAVGAAIVAAVFCRIYLDIRPDLFLFLGTTAVVALVDAYRQGARAGVLLLLPLVMALWVNLHGSFLFGLGVIGLYAAAELLKTWLGLPDAPLPIGRVRWLGAAAVASALACLLNPEGSGAFRFAFALLTPEAAVWRAQTVEWIAPVLFRSGDFNPASFGWLLVGEAVLTLAGLVLAPRRVDLSDTALTAVAAVMALRARRFIPLFALVSVPFLARNLALLRARLVTTAGPGLPRGRGAVGAAALAVAALATLAVRAVPEVRAMQRDGVFAWVIDASFFPHAAVEFLRLNALPARLFHLYAWGSSRSERCSSIRAGTPSTRPRSTACTPRWSSARRRGRTCSIATAWSWCSGRPPPPPAGGSRSSASCSSPGAGSASTTTGRR
jgi:hypothetical protein